MNIQTPRTEQAELLVEVTRQLEPLQAREKELKEVMRTYEGETITTSDGSTVKISKSTEDRETGTILRFNEDAYWKLGPELRAEMEKQGIVAMVPKITKGSIARVTVKLC